jgi:hypothetical protein
MIQTASLHAELLVSASDQHWLANSIVLVIDLRSFGLLSSRASNKVSYRIQPNTSKVAIIVL